MGGSRILPWCIVVGATVGGVYSGAQMARRIGRFNVERPREVYAFKDVADRDFSFAGRPVAIRDESERGVDYVAVSYGDRSVRLPVGVPGGDRRLPGLLPYADWLRVFRFASATGVTIGEVMSRMESGEAPDRLVIVSRTPEPGTEAMTAGAASVRSWVFDFYELLPDGEMAHDRRAFARTSRYRRPAPPSVPPLEERSWQYQAALLVMPPGSAPTPSFLSDGLTAMGWTLAGTSFSLLAAVGAFAWAIAPRRRAT